MADIPPAIVALMSTGDTQKFYASPAWRNARKQAITRDHHTCTRCKAKGVYAPGTVVHHVREIKTVPALALTLDNLVSLCHTCHEDIHGRGAGVSRQNDADTAIPERW